MRSLLAAALVLGMTAWAGTAQAANIGGAAASCRASPSARAAVVERLGPNSPVDVLGSRQTWSRVRTQASRTCWIATRLLAGSSALPLVSTASHRRAAKATRARRSTSIRSGRSSRAFGGGSCPCGGGNVCVGPRGGRYCITSGGNKRYGM